MTREIKEDYKALKSQIQLIKNNLDNRDLGKFHTGRYEDLKWQYEKLLNAISLNLPQPCKDRIKIHILEIHIKIDKIEVRLIERKKAKGQTGLQLYQNL